MKRTISSLLFTVFFIYSLAAQFPDNTWLLGYGGGYEIQDSFWVSILNFDNNKLSIGPELEIPAFYDMETNIPPYPITQGLYYFTLMDAKFITIGMN